MVAPSKGAQPRLRGGRRRGALRTVTEGEANGGASRGSGEAGEGRTKPPITGEQPGASRLRRLRKAAHSERKTCTAPRSSRVEALWRELPDGRLHGSAQCDGPSPWVRMRSDPAVVAGPGSTRTPYSHWPYQEIGERPRRVLGEMPTLRRGPSRPRTRPAPPRPAPAPAPRTPRAADSIHSSRARYGRSARRPAPTPSTRITGAGLQDARGRRSGAHASRTGHSARSCRAASGSITWAQQPVRSSANSSSWRGDVVEVQHRRAAERRRRAARRRCSSRSRRARRRRSAGPVRRRAAARAQPAGEGVDGEVREGG